MAPVDGGHEMNKNGRFTFFHLRSSAFICG